MPTTSDNNDEIYNSLAFKDLYKEFVPQRSRADMQTTHDYVASTTIKKCRQSLMEYLAEKKINLLLFDQVKVEIENIDSKYLEKIQNLCDNDTPLNAFLEADEIKGDETFLNAILLAWTILSDRISFSEEEHSTIQSASDQKAMTSEIIKKRKELFLKFLIIDRLSENRVCHTGRYNAIFEALQKLHPKVTLVLDTAALSELLIIFYFRAFKEEFEKFSFQKQIKLLQILIEDHSDKIEECWKNKEIYSPLLEKDSEGHENEFSDMFEDIKKSCTEQIEALGCDPDRIWNKNKISNKMSFQDRLLRLSQGLPPFYFSLLQAIENVFIEENQKPNPVLNPIENVKNWTDHMNSLRTQTWNIFIKYYQKNNNFIHLNDLNFSQEELNIFFESFLPGALTKKILFHLDDSDCQVHLSLRCFSSLIKILKERKKNDPQNHSLDDFLMEVIKKENGKVKIDAVFLYAYEAYQRKDFNALIKRLKQLGNWQELTWLLSYWLYRSSKQNPVLPWYGVLQQHELEELFIYLYTLNPNKKNNLCYIYHPQNQFMEMHKKTWSTEKLLYEAKKNDSPVANRDFFLNALNNDSKFKRKCCLFYLRLKLADATLLKKVLAHSNSVELFVIAGSFSLLAIALIGVIAAAAQIMPLLLGVFLGIGIALPCYFGILRMTSNIDRKISTYVNGLHQRIKKDQEKLIFLEDREKNLDAQEKERKEKLNEQSDKIDKKSEIYKNFINIKHSTLSSNDVDQLNQLRLNSKKNKLMRIDTNQIKAHKKRSELFYSLFTNKKIGQIKNNSEEINRLKRLNISENYLIMRTS